MVKGDEGYFDVQPRRLERVAMISPVESEVLVEDITINEGETFQLSPVLDTGLGATYDFICYNDDIATVSGDGFVTGISAGTTSIIISPNLIVSEPYYEEPDTVSITVTVIGKGNAQKLSGRGCQSL